MSPLSTHPHVADSLGHSRRVLWEALPMRGWPVCSACRHCRRRAPCRHGAHSSGLHTRVLKGGRKCCMWARKGYRVQTELHVSHLLFQENKKMYQGSPCKDLYPTEYFPHGITNGAQWYNVPGKVNLQSLGYLQVNACAA